MSSAAAGCNGRAYCNLFLAKMLQELANGWMMNRVRACAEGTRCWAVHCQVSTAVDSCLLLQHNVTQLIPRMPHALVQSTITEQLWLDKPWPIVGAQSGR